MNYTKHYNALINRARNRSISDHTEKHRIIPGCLGGTYSPENVVSLTPEEHYVAHQLLIKMYPCEGKLVYAARMMTIGSCTHKRGNKLYGWLKRKHIKECRRRIGKNNPSYGKSWYHNPETKENGKFLKEDVPIGWIKGRVPLNKCQVCGKKISTHAKHCNKHAPAIARKGKNVFFGREKEFCDLYDKYGSLNRACKELGLPGAVGGWYKQANKILKERNNAPGYG